MCSGLIFCSLLSFALLLISILSFCWFPMMAKWLQQFPASQLPCLEEEGRQVVQDSSKSPELCAIWLRPRLQGAITEGGI